MKLLLLLMLMLSAFFLNAQNEMPSFGEFSRQELSLTQCDFDKDADAIILFDVANSGYNDQHNLLTTRRVRLKILKQKGIDKANIEIPYYSKDDFENVSRIEAISYTNSDNGGVRKELDRKTIFRQKVNEIYSVVKFTLPNVKVGTIIEYEYETFAKNYGGLDNWYFQSDLPVILSRFSVTMVPNAEFTYVVHKAPDIPIKINSDGFSATTHFEMNNIAGLRHEPYMDARRDYLQYVEFQFAGYVNSFGNKVSSMTTWKQSALELMTADYFGRQLHKDLSDSKEITIKASTFPTPYARMNFIYEYVRNNFAWNRINSPYASDGIKNAWTARKGTSGEINLILINLLKQADLEVYPLMVSEREHGKVNTKFPMLDQFNKVVAYVLIDNRRFVLDATNTNTPVNIIPFDLLNTNAFIVNNKKPEVIKLTDDTKSSSNFVNINSSISNDGMVNGYASVSSYDYAKVSRLEDYRNDKQKFQHDYFEEHYPEIRIDSFETINTETDSVQLRQQFNFTLPAVMSGDYKLINVNMFSGLEKNQFTLDSRFSDIDFGCIHTTSINENFEIPPDLKLEEIPKNVRLVTPDKSITFIRTAELNENIITIQISLKINKTIYTADEYPILKEFYKKMYDLLNEQIVLSKK